MRGRTQALPIVTVAALALGLPLRAAAQRVNLPRVTRATLPNGMRVWLMEYRRAPVVAVRLAFDGGSATDRADRAGTADLMADLLPRGAGSRSAQEFAEALDLIGADLGAYAGPDRVVVSLDALVEDTDAALDLMADAVRRPELSADELARRRDVMAAGLRSALESPESLADRVAAQTVYPGHPYGTMPTLASLRRIEAADIQAAYGRIVAPGRAVLVAVGEFRATDMLRRLRARFADWHGDAAAPAAVPPVPAPAVGQGVTVVDKPELTQTQVRFVGGAPRRGDARAMALDVAATIVGGSFTSRLTNEVRVARSLTYGIGAAASAHRAGGAFKVSTFTRVETTGRLLRVVRDTLQRAADRGITPGELKRTVAYLSGAFAIGVQTPEQVAAQLLDVAYYGLPPDHVHTYLQRLRAVTVAQVNAAIRTVMAPRRLAVVMVGPAAGVRAQSGVGTVRAVAPGRVIEGDEQ